MFSGGEKTISLADFGFLKIPLESNFHYPHIFITDSNNGCSQKYQSAHHLLGDYRTWNDLCNH
jgi:hypothetical protein